jgi:hypothetical protein
MGQMIENEPTVKFHKLFLAFHPGPPNLLFWSIWALRQNVEKYPLAAKLAGHDFPPRKKWQMMNRNLWLKKQKCASFGLKC